MALNELDTRRIAIEDKTKLVRQEGTLPARTVLQQRYEILSLQATGGMGAVYRARDLRFSAVTKVVAVKEMANLAPDPQLRRISIQNFEREANILASLSHVAIPKIFDFFSESNRSYLIMEFVEGTNLEELSQQHKRPFEVSEVVDWALQACDVLSYLHSHQPPVVFRDIKPGNLILRPDGRLMVIDFGIAKVFEHGQRGTMIGTEGYSPPEQYRGIAGPQGDLYALGATMHHLLTTQDPRLEPPFTFHERPITSANPDMPPQLEAVVMKALAYDAQERFATASELAMAMNRALPRGDRPRTRTATTSLVTSVGAGLSEVRPLWTFRCEDEVRSSARVADGVLYIGSYDHNVYALDVRDGSFLWKYPTEDGIASTPCIYQGTVLIGSEDGALYALARQSGEKLWDCPTGRHIRSSASVEWGHAFFGSDDGCLYALNIESGRIVWKFQAGGPVRSTPLIFDEAVFFGSDDGYVYALEMQSGSIKWKYNTNRRVTSSPALGDGLIFVGSADGNLYGLNLKSGWPVWRFRTRGYILSSPATADGMVYVGSVDHYLYCVDASTGRERWKYETEAAITSSPALADDIICIGSNDGAVHVASRDRGQPIWRFPTGGPVPSSPLVYQNTVFVGSTDHRVYALPL